MSVEPDRKASTPAGEAERLYAFLCDQVAQLESEEGRKQFRINRVSKELDWVKVTGAAFLS